MNEKKIKEQLIKSLNDSIPNSFDDILLRCNNLNKERNYNMETKKKRKFLFKFTFAVFFLFLIGGVVYFSYNNNLKVDSIIDIDVNPSIELQVNKKEEIVKYSALNDDAKEILKDMDLKKVDIDVALNAIIGSMVTKGYIDDISNSILISVDNDNKVKGEELRQKLVDKVNNILGTDKINGSVLSQTINDNENNSEANRLVEKYGISLGKANLILDVLKSNSLLTEKDLVNLSINEINVLTQNKKNNLTNVEKQGNASTKSYIGKEKAKSIALNHAGISKVNTIEIEFDADDGIIVYEVEFTTNKYEYDYEINALNGNIVKHNKEINDDYIDNSSNKNYDNNNNNSSNSSSSSSNSNSTNSNYISSSKAKSIALNHANVANPDRIKVELDREDNEYSVEFQYNGKEYDYEINAITGKIIDYDYENIDDD